MGIEPASVSKEVIGDPSLISKATMCLCLLGYVTSVIIAKCQQSLELTACLYDAEGALEGSPLVALPAPGGVRSTLGADVAQHALKFHHVSPQILLYNTHSITYRLKYSCKIHILSVCILFKLCVKRHVV